MVERQPVLSPSALPSQDCGVVVRSSGEGGGWRFLLLVELVDFVTLRRKLGCAGVESLVSALVRRLAGVDPGAHVAASGRNVIEVSAIRGERSGLEQWAARFREALADPVDVAGGACLPVIAIGSAVGPVGDAHDAVALAEAAETMLGEARHRLAATVPARTAAESRLAAELSRAIRHDELSMLYQPKVHVRRQEIDSAEALVRWQHPQQGAIPPGDFITLAEEAQLIDQLTLWTIRRVIRDQRTLRAAGHDLRLFINISGQLLGDAAFIGEVCQLVSSCDATLGFEVTETSVIRDPTSAITNLQKLSDIGITIAIDDYGAGLSSLAYLKQLPARELKIDKLFVTQLTSSNRDPLIVRSTIDLAHALEMEVVAEGVESHAALALLSVMGCDMVQGFLISRPITIDALAAFLQDARNQHHAQHSRASFVSLASAWKRG